ncbi:hypothetical protein TNCV_4899481 [Trichonephila clavipes]|nr:hypothetical protein TNCV_4899481 [Trichonephila clavipes]
MIPAYNKKCTAFPFETGIHFRRKTDFLPEEDTIKPYSGFEPESTRLQAEVILTSHFKTTQGMLMTDNVVLNHGHVTKTLRMLRWHSVSKLRHLTKRRDLIQKLSNLHQLFFSTMSHQWQQNSKPGYSSRKIMTITHAVEYLNLSFNSSDVYESIVTVKFIAGVIPKYESILSCQVIYSQFGLAIHQNDHHARRRFVEWAQNEIAVVPDLHKRILFSDEAHFWLNGYVNKQNCRIWSEANPQVYVETPLHPEKLTVWCALWAGGIVLQKR